MFGIAKLLLFAALVVLGIVFVPDGFMDRVGRGIDSAGSYLSGEAAKRAPEIKQDISQQTQETKSEAVTLYQSFKEKYYPAARDRVMKFLIFWQ